MSTARTRTLEGAGSIATAGRGLCLLMMFLLGQTASAQSTAPTDGQSTFRADTGERSGRWTPLGPASVDQVGTGSRGYVLPMEDSTVTAARSNRFSIHAVAANFFYLEQTSGFLVSQRHETHTIALDYRRGFKAPRGPRFEIGGQFQLHQRDSGMLNGFIEGFESVVASLTGKKSAQNELRKQAAARPPQGILIAQGGTPIYRDTGTGTGIGDTYLLAKVSLLDPDPASRATSFSVRAGINVAGRARFSEGNFAGVGVSVDKKLVEWAAFHGDVRATRVLDSISVWQLPLKRWAYGFSAGSEVKLSTNSSFIMQFGGSSIPYMPSGMTAFDKGQGDVTLGLAHRFTSGSRHVTTHLYLRENLNLPFRVRWNTDPDLSIGLKATIH